MSQDFAIFNINVLISRLIHYSKKIVTAYPSTIQVELQTFGNAIK